MILKGRIRGNGAQLAQYLLTQGENESVRVFDIRGTSQPNNLRASLIEMSLTAELSGRTKKGLYHVVINPRPGEDRAMTAADWHRAAEIVELERRFTRQKRVMVLHEKNGRLHMHVAWERYDHATGRMICNKHSRRDQDRARKRMELEFGHFRTPDVNMERPELHKLLSRVWVEQPTGKGFIQSMAAVGFTVARSDDRRDFAIINSIGQSFDLDRELKGVRIKLIRERLKGIRLPEKKRIIANIRAKQKDRSKETAREKKARELREQFKPHDKSR